MYAEPSIQSMWERNRAKATKISSLRSCSTCFETSQSELDPARSRLQYIVSSFLLKLIIAHPSRDAPAIQSVPDPSSKHLAQLLA